MARLFPIFKDTLPVPAPTTHQFVERVRPLSGILRFTRVSIDQLVNCPIAKRQVLGYYKLHCQIQATIERVDLERQWNPHRP